jgi:hypothetical protein
MHRLRAVVASLPVWFKPDTAHSPYWARQIRIARADFIALCKRFFATEIYCDPMKRIIGASRPELGVGDPERRQLLDRREAPYRPRSVRVRGGLVRAASRRRACK